MLKRKRKAVELPQDVELRDFCNGAFYAVLVDGVDVGVVCPCVSDRRKPWALGWVSGSRLGAARGRRRHWLR